MHACMHACMHAHMQARPSVDIHAYILTYLRAKAGLSIKDCRKATERDDCLSSEDGRSVNSADPKCCWGSTEFSADADGGPYWCQAREWISADEEKDLIDTCQKAIQPKCSCIPRIILKEGPPSREVVETFVFEGFTSKSNCYLEQSYSTLLGPVRTLLKSVTVTSQIWSRPETNWDQSGPNGTKSETKWAPLPQSSYTILVGIIVTYIHLVDYERIMVLLCVRHVWIAIESWARYLLIVREWIRIRHGAHLDYVGMMHVSYAHYLCNTHRLGVFGIHYAWTMHGQCVEYRWFMPGVSKEHNWIWHGSCTDNAW